MLVDPNVSKEEILDFVREASFVEEEKVKIFLENVSSKYPLIPEGVDVWEEMGDAIDPIYEGIVPPNWDEGAVPLDYTD